MLRGFSSGKENPDLFRVSLTGIGRWSSLAGCDGPSGCLPAAFEIPTSPTSWPRATSRRRGLDSCLRSQMEWKPRFYWGPGYLVLRLVGGGFPRYAVFCVSPFG